MSKIASFTDLEAWKINHQIVLAIYKLTVGFPKEEKFGIIDQLRRAASSVTANIAEGFGRYHYPDKLRFYYQARGSNSEVANFLILAKDLGLIKEKEFDALYSLIIRGGQVINGLIRVHATG
ncbi:MAG TPA: four helix bundle protein [Patescibacteria group bacterium]|nr:four helix bundle protein [Patescibacteria group bacterium]